MRFTFAAARRRHEIARPFDAQAGIARNALVVLRRARRKGQIRELMDDCVRRRRADSARERLRIENINHHRLGPERAHALGFVGRPRAADDGMSDRAQQRRELAPDRPACTGQKDFHCALIPRRRTRLRRSTASEPCRSAALERGDRPASRDAAFGRSRVSALGRAEQRVTPPPSTAPAPRRSWPCGQPPPRVFPFLPRPHLPLHAP